MMLPLPGSDRRSDRVELPGTPATEFAGLYGATAPESMAPPRVSGSPPPERGAKRVGRRRLESIERDLSGREQAILTDLSRFRFLTTGQVQTLHFHHHATNQAAARICRRVLERLQRLRVIEHLDRRIGGIRAGSASYVWRVGLVGDRLARAQQGDGSRGRRKEPSTRHLDHTLAVADCYCRLVHAARSGKLELLTVAPEPSSWRRYLAVGGTAETLKPDLFAVTASQDYEDHWFIELDRSTESLPTIVRKCAQYEQYRRTGREQADGGVFPIVVWVVPDDYRTGQVQHAISLSRGLDPQLYRVITADRFLEAITGGVSPAPE